jgi:hypothetical protein
VILVNRHLSNTASDVADVAWDYVAPASAHSEQYVLVAEDDIHWKDKTTGSAERTLIVLCGRPTEVMAVVPGSSRHRGCSHLTDLLLLNAARSSVSAVEIRSGLILARRNGVASLDQWMQ